jgi:hypothetical protein
MLYHGEVLLHSSELKKVTFLQATKKHSGTCQGYYSNIGGSSSNWSFRFTNLSDLSGSGLSSALYLYKYFAPPLLTLINVMGVRKYYGEHELWENGLAME